MHENEQEKQNYPTSNNAGLTEIVPPACASNDVVNVDIVIEQLLFTKVNG